MPRGASLDRHYPFKRVATAALLSYIAFHEDIVVLWTQCQVARYGYHLFALEYQHLQGFIAFFKVHLDATCK